MEIRDSRFETNNPNLEFDRISNPMPYQFLEHIAIADAAFQAWGETVEEMFIAASDAIINIMVDNLDAVSSSGSSAFSG